MADLDRIRGRHPEIFVLISQLKVCQERGGQEGSFWRKLRNHDRRHGRHVTPDIMNDIFYPKEDTLKILC